MTTNPRQTNRFGPNNPSSKPTRTKISQALCKITKKNQNSPPSSKNSFRAARVGIADPSAGPLTSSPLLHRELRRLKIAGRLLRLPGGRDDDRGDALAFLRGARPRNRTRRVPGRRSPGEGLTPRDRTPTLGTRQHDRRAFNEAIARRTCPQRRLAARYVNQRARCVVGAKAALSFSLSRGQFACPESPWGEG